MKGHLLPTPMVQCSMQNVSVRVSPACTIPRWAKNGLRPKIGNNVQLGCGVTILGGVSIGDNVIIGAERLVLKDIPSNCIVAGNPAYIIRELKEGEKIYLHWSETRQHVE